MTTATPKAPLTPRRQNSRTAFGHSMRCVAQHCFSLALPRDTGWYMMADTFFVGDRTTSMSIPSLRIHIDLSHSPSAPCQKSTAPSGPSPSPSPQGGRSQCKQRHGSRPQTVRLVKICRTDRWSQTMRAPPNLGSPTRGKHGGGGPYCVQVSLRTALPWWRLACLSGRCITRSHRPLACLGAACGWLARTCPTGTWTCGNVETGLIQTRSAGLAPHRWATRASPLLGLLRLDHHSPDLHKQNGAMLHFASLASQPRNRKQYLLWGPGARGGSRYPDGQ